MSWLEHLRPGRRSAVPEATAVGDFYRSLLLHVEPEPLYASALARLGDLAGCDDLALVLLDPERGDLRLQASRGSWPDTLKEASWPAAGALARWLATNRRALLLETDREVVEDLPASEAAPLEPEARVVVPLEAADRLGGFLLLGATARPGGWTRERSALLATLAVPAALAFEHAALVRERGDRLRRLYRAERLATAGTLAAGLAHEIRNPLTAIRTGIQVVRDGADTAPETAEVLGDVIHEVDRIDRLVGGLLLFARAPRATRESVDLADVVRRAALLVEPKARAAGVHLQTRLDASPRVEGDPGELEQVVLNLLLNAVEAVESDGGVELAVWSEPVHGGARAVLEVRDGGPGLPAELGDRVFDPFVTTKREGSGLGLPISFQIVRRHGGDLTLAGRPGGGGVARVSLPMIAEEP
jgi:signal transduction histidine kinase